MLGFFLCQRILGNALLPIGNVAGSNYEPHLGLLQVPSIRQHSDIANYASSIQYQGQNPQ
jgi:hypothetical protein